MMARDSKDTCAARAVAAATSGLQDAAASLSLSCDAVLRVLLVVAAVRLATWTQARESAAGNHRREVSTVIPDQETKGKREREG